MIRDAQKRAQKRIDFYECAVGANLQILKGNTIHQKFWCANCGKAQYLERPNTFYAQGKCEECEHISDLLKDGCNYLLIATGDKVIEHLDEVNSFVNKVQSGKLD